ncbi:ALBINO3-like protein 1, chloroplastic isoform X2 [Camellia sinensis]|uniref:ALBINO3-like protein 1, chloroplastic isoform X2 n=1 Tax=Camellia sinensis TaxID=4442 RepID=UPI001035D5C0|nr:ALBINO3-like protein 1, chloroplastic isoform X2 [Camellia sinensis]
MLTLYPSYSLFSATADVTRSPPSALPQTSYLRASVSAAAVASSIQDLGTDIEKHHEVLADGLATLHVPYAYGFAIILLAVLVKAATFPLSKKQVESAMAMQSLQPQIKAIQQRYAEDQERIHLETARLYKLAGINPLAGCLPTLAIIPIWVGLYRSLSNAADEIFPE